MTPCCARFSERLPGLESRIDLQHGIWPELAVVKTSLDKLLDAVVQDVDEALEVVAVFADYLIAQTKDVKRHRDPNLSWNNSATATVVYAVSAGTWALIPLAETSS